MPTALTGSMGWTGLHPLQLGGPPLISTFDRPLSSQALPLIAHVYGADGVTSLGTLTVLNRPTISVMLANGGPASILLEVATRNPVPVYGQVVYGQPVYGAQVVHGNIIRLTEQGGDGRSIYAGIVESLPDVIEPSQVVHQIGLTPFAMELGRAYVQENYTFPTDVAQMARDAVAATMHCHCDQVSIPTTTGIMGVGDFRNRPAQELLDTARAIAGASWFWHVDIDGRTWFQPMGSVAYYTLKRGVDYESRTSNGGDITDRKNKVVAVGGVPPGAGANASATYDGASQASLGVRALNPPLALPGITDEPTLQAIARGVGQALDRAWQRVSIKAPSLGANLVVPSLTIPGFGQRIHASRPGGAMLRYWEPNKNALQQSEVGGGYAGPFIGQSVDWDGLYQDIQAGDVPITDQRDIDALVTALVGRAAANSLQVTAAALNLTDQVMSGSFQSAPGPGAKWTLDPNEFSATDPFGAVRAEMGNLPANGISPAQWGFRANDVNGNPIFDSMGLIAVMAEPGGQTHTGGLANQNFTSTTPALVTGSAITFTPTRTLRYLIFANAVAVVNPAGTPCYIALFVDGVNQCGFASNLAMPATFQNNQTATASLFWSGMLTGGVSHTIDLRGSVGSAGPTFTTNGCDLYCFQLGG